MGYGTTNRSARVRQTVLMGLMFALAMVLSYVESMITVPGLPPGVKLGLSNIVTMYCVFFLGWRQGLYTGCAQGQFCPAHPGIYRCLYEYRRRSCIGYGDVLLILPKKLNLSYTLISVLGSLGHNFGQLLMASVIMKSGFVIYYLPIMAVSGVGMGVATGVLLRVMLPYMNKLQLVKH